MIKTKIKRRYFILIHIILIFFLCFLLLFLYARKTNQKIEKMASKYYDKKINIKLNSLLQNITESIDYDYLIVNKNQKDEIISVDYDLKKTYELVEKVTQKLTDDIQNNDLKNMIIKMPFFVGSNNVFLNSYGPSVNIKMYYMDTVLVNIKTKITNYGLNNVLAQVYVVVSLDGMIITPLDKKHDKKKYELLISSKLINGRVPEFYGKSLTASSVTFDIPIAR